MLLFYHLELLVFTLYEIFKMNKNTQQEKQFEYDGKSLTCVIKYAMIM